MPDAPVRRSTFTVDLGADLDAQLRAAAAAKSQSPSQWAREVIQRAADEDSPKRPRKRAAHESTGRPPRAGRLALDEELANLLGQVLREGQFRSRPAALRLVLRQFLGSDKKQASHPTDTSALKDGVAALMRSNYELGQVGINVNQIAKALNSLQGSFRTKERDNLQAFVQEAREHIGQASKVAAAMRKLLTPRKETR